MNQFYEGTRVVAVGVNMFGLVKRGDLGTVVSTGGMALGIRWDTFHISRHNCQIPERCPCGHGTFVLPSEIKLAPEEDDLNDFMIHSLAEEVL